MPVGILDDLGSLFPPQRELLRSGFLSGREDWLICTPTGSGKTLMAEWALLQAVRHGRRAAYVAPLKAIVEERLEDWGARYGDVPLGLYTGDSTKLGRGQLPAGEKLLLLTPEKLVAYLHAWKRNLRWLSELDVVVVDEFHLIGDRSRGSAIEAMISRLRRVNPYTRFVGLSGTLANRDEVADWMSARVFASDWRPISIDRRLVNFKKVTDKFDLLMSEIVPTLRDGGKALVFVNSRRRSENLATQLQRQGIDADFNHAGLSQARRVSTQRRLRQGKVEVVVSTSALEMGVNFPARKVVIYDSYGFDGVAFSPISVQRYLQCSGRAGRAGYDSRGEAVLFLPTWANGEDYLRGIPEPVRSGFFTSCALEREILAEVASRLSISEEHLETNFARSTLWRRQGGKENIAAEVAHLLEAGLLRREEEKGRYLSETPLGRIASKMGMAPASVLQLRRFFDRLPDPSEFDLLLGACLCEEATPKLGFNFEEIDAMADLLLAVSSRLLDAVPDELYGIAGHERHRVVLSAIKCAVLLSQHVGGRTLEDLAEQYDCYPADLQLLKKNVGWVLAAGQQAFAVLWRDLVEQEEGEELGSEQRGVSRHERLARDLILMVDCGIPREFATLARVKGIGPQRARKLIAAGVGSAEQLAGVDIARLRKILRMSAEKAQVILNAAAGCVATTDELPVDAGVEACACAAGPAAALPSIWNAEIDPYRLRRALELQVDHSSGEAVRISGGTEPHVVSVEVERAGRRRYTCDCADFAAGHHQCKHVLRARLELRDDADLLPLLRQLQSAADTPLRYALGSLWLRVSETYDAFNGRKVDYGGSRFVVRAREAEESRR